MLRKLCSIFLQSKTKIDASTVDKFRSKLNYAAEAMLIFFYKNKTKTIDTIKLCCGSYAQFFFIKTKQKLDTSTVGKFSSKLNYAVEASSIFFYKNKTKTIYTSTVGKFRSKLYYAVEAMLNFFL